MGNKFYLDNRIDRINQIQRRIERKKIYLIIKRVLDILFSLLLLAVFALPLVIIAFIIFLEDFKNPFFLQTRITKEGRKFEILKFRSMKKSKITVGSLVTSKADGRVTKVGRVIRKYRIDEIPQLLNVLKGDMSFVGPRPEVEKFVEHYTDEMMVTLLLPAGITSIASIKFKDEDQMLQRSQLYIDEAYITEVLPIKMEYNIDYLERFSFLEDITIIFLTIKEVFF